MEVRATAEGHLDTASPRPLIAGGQDVINSAGTYGDISRYLQTFPGVVASSDLSNQMLVRGGHPMENLFLVDGIEVPNINHLATANSTGGLGPMIDAAAIQGLSLSTGGFDARYPERLSSVTQFGTLDSLQRRRHLELDLGIQGAGGMLQKRVGRGDLLVSAHHGLMNLVSHNVGINGVPSYTNVLTRYRQFDSSGNHLSLLNVSGWDSIDIQPCASDTKETSTINSEYRGWRETTGVEWQHISSPRSFAVLNASDSEQIEHIHQRDQIADPTKVSTARVPCPLPRNAIQTTPVYLEDSNNAFSTVGYRYEWAADRVALTMGTSAWLQRPDIDVSQPQGALSPYLENPVHADQASFYDDFSTGETGTYAQTLVHPIRSLAISAGGRVQTFAFGDHITLTPRLNATWSPLEKASVHVAYADYAQLPPYAHLLAYPVNRGLKPMRVTHEIAGLNLAVIPSLQVRIEGYNKDYRDIPASTEYASVTIHTMVEMLGEQIVWLPMNSGGHGNSSGVELSDLTRLGSRFQMQGSVAYARAKFAGTDGTLRPSNFDFPWIVNAAALARLGHKWTASSRYGYATGRPYTPLRMAESVAQNRPIYDLAEVNRLRAPYYSRLDAQVNKEIRIYNTLLELYGGVDNILNRSNFLSYAWMPRYSFRNPQRNPIDTLWQTPIFPNFGVRVILQ